jgi:hypothetical protein
MGATVWMWLEIIFVFPLVVQGWWMHYSIAL